jgi:hypothetical protein
MHIIAYRFDLAHTRRIPEKTESSGGKQRAIETMCFSVAQHPTRGAINGVFTIGNVIQKRLNIRRVGKTLNTRHSSGIQGIVELCEHVLFIPDSPSTVKQLHLEQVEF